MRPDAQLAELASRQHGVFTRAQALEAGLSERQIDRRLNQGLLLRVHRGVYRGAGTPLTYRARVMAGCLATGGVASHATAAALFGLLPEGPIEVTVPRGSRRRRRGIAVRETRDLVPGDTATMEAIPVTTPTRTVIDLASTLDNHRFELVLDDALRRRLTSRRRLERRLSELPDHGRAGIQLVRTSLSRRGSGPGAAETRLERQFFAILRKHRIHGFEPQVWVEVEGNRYRIDALHRVAGIAIELDEDHHREPAQHEADLERQNALVKLGLKVLRFNERQLRNGRRVARRVRALLASLPHPDGR